MTDGTIAALRQALNARRPKQVARNGRRPAAVAAVLRTSMAGDELLLIQRSAREGDPWSGHLAFPGGRIEEGDSSPRAAAERETQEELGLKLACHTYIGQLDDITGATIPVVVSGFVYALEGPETLTPNEEVETAFWVPIPVLCDGVRHLRQTFTIRGEAHEYPCVDVAQSDTPVLWGLTYRFCHQLAERAGIPFGPAPGK